MSERHHHHHHHHRIIGRYFEIVNLYPRIEDPALASRIEEFTMSATPEQLFAMQEAVFDAARRFMLDDPRWKTILEHLDGKRIGLAIGKEYGSTVLLEHGDFHLERERPDRHVPVLSVASRKDYVDAILRRRDITRMLLGGRLHATHKLTLARWGLSFFHLLADDELFEGVLGRQVRAEEIISEALASMRF